MKLKNTVVALMFSVFAASSLASSGLEGQAAPDFALKSSCLLYTSDAADEVVPV